MKIRCMRQIDERTGAPIERSPWLTVGDIYHVLEIVVSERGVIKFRLLGDDKRTPALHLSMQFELVSGFIPACWAVRFEADGSLKLAPNTWTERGFWERYFEGSARERQIFEDTYKAIIAEEA
jgi:hypothetical protein